MKGCSPVWGFFRRADGFVVRVAGRNCWTLRQLIAAGAAGCTPLTHPAPRWSAYVMNLRGLGFDIETRTERHEGPYAGNHGRYILHGTVTEVLV